MKSIQYFAYGSNMLTERLRLRCRSAAVRGTLAICGFRLDFNKESRDGSGKATINPCQQIECRVYGVVFDLAESELPILDKFEGAGQGYDRIELLQAHCFGIKDPMRVITYIAGPRYTDNNLKPYDWYLGLVVAGARQHSLPSEYVAAIENVPSLKDPMTDRTSRLEALRLLGDLPS
jgi:gamma-glutamylcyclotransferase